MKVQVTFEVKAEDVDHLVNLAWLLEGYSDMYPYNSDAIQTIRFLLDKIADSEITIWEVGALKELLECGALRRIRQDVEKVIENSLGVELHAT
jgi:hypothetical protein